MLKTQQLGDLGVIDVIEGVRGIRMKKQRIHFKSQAGSSLIGVALLTLIMGFLISGGLFLLQNYGTIQADQKSVDYSREIEMALQNFVALEGRYPCPAPLNAAPDSPEFGKEGSAFCNTVDGGTFRVPGRDGLDVRIGAVPTRTLGVPDKIMADGYGKRYFYAITEDLTKTTANPQSDLGAITLFDVNGRTVSETEGYILYALISPGEDLRGAYDLQGNLLEPCEIGTDAGNNCDFTDATFRTVLKNFSGDSNTFTHNFAFRANATPYRWHVDRYSTCNGVCFSGEQERDVTCRDDKNTIVPVSEELDEDRCGHTAKPSTNRACALPPCHYWAQDLPYCVPGGIGPYHWWQTTRTRTTCS